MDRAEREARVLTYLSEHDDWPTSAVIAGDLSVNRNTLLTALKHMVDEGQIVSRIPAKGGGYRLAVKTAPATPPAPAPVIPPPERLADEAPAPDSLRPQVGPALAAGLRPFAGIDASSPELYESTQELAEHYVVSGRDLETFVLALMVRMLEDLDRDAQLRVAAYVGARYL